MDSSNNLLIADADNERIRMVSASTQIIMTVAGTGGFAFFGDGGPALSAEFEGPLAVAVDMNGDIVIADTGNQRIREVVTGIINTVAGNGLGFSGDTSPATDASLNSPRGVAVDAAGNVFIADTDNQRVRMVDTTGHISTVAGDGTASFSGDGGPATSAELNFPEGVAVDSSGNLLYIADTDNQRIREVDVTAGTISTVAGNGTAGSGGDGGPATGANLNFPSGVAVDTAGNLYIADLGNNRVRKVDVTTGNISTAAGNGVQGFGGDGGPATSANLSFPEGVAVDSSGNLYIADTNNQRIRKVDSTGTITTVAGNGTPGFGGDGGPAASASLNYPSGVTADPAVPPNLFIADVFNQRVRRVDASSGGIISVAGDGSLGSYGDGGPATSAELGSPPGVALDGSGNLYVADTLNNRVRLVTNPNLIGPIISLSPATLSFAQQPVGTTSPAQAVTISNTGIGSLNITVTVSAGFTQTNNCAIVAGGTSCAIMVSFAPTASGPTSGTLTLTDNAASSPQTLSLTGTGTAPAVELSTNNVAFGNQLVGTTAAAPLVNLTNTGTASLNITTITIGGTNASDFTQSQNCGTVVGAGIACALSITFTPSATGVRTATLTITDNVSGSPQAISLTGTGIEPAVTLSGAAVTFGNQGVNTTSPVGTVILTDTGTSPLSISLIAASGDFTATQCGSSLSTGASCTINITFDPTALGSRAGAITIVDSAPDSPQTVSLSGAGVLAYSLNAAMNSATVIRGTDSASFGIAATTPYGFNGSVSLACPDSAPAKCAFNPPSIMPGQSSTLTLSNLTGVSAGSLSFTVTGANGVQSTSLPLLVDISDFSLTASHPAATVSGGQSASYTLGITPSNGFSQGVSFRCGGVPAEATCAIMPGSVTLNGTNAATATITVTTTQHTLAPLFIDLRTGLPIFVWLVALGALLSFVAFRRRRFAVVLAAIILLAAMWTSCGGGSGQVLQVGTPSGVYTLNVTASSGSLSHEIPLTLVVN